jgi:diphthine-ammonia ligase
LPFTLAGLLNGLACRIVSAGIEARLIKIACMGLTPRKHLGKTLQDVRETLHRLNSEFGAHICGEGGEFETFTTDCPLYKSRIIVSLNPKP